MNVFLTAMRHVTDSCIVRSLLIAVFLPASAVAGEIYGNIDVQPSYYAVPPKPGTVARRIALPPAEQRPPAGLIIVLEGDRWRTRNSTLPPSLSIWLPTPTACNRVCCTAKSA